MPYPTRAPGLRFTYEWFYLDAHGNKAVLSDDVSLTPTGNASPVPPSVALSAGASAVIWVATAHTAAFTTGIFDALGTTLELELTVKDGDANEELVLLTLVPGRPPTVLGSSASRYNHSANDAFAGTAGAFDKIRVKNPSGTTAGTLLCHLVY